MTRCTPRTRFLLPIASLAFSALAIATDFVRPASAGISPGDWGDAPEGYECYATPPTTGRFPTCIGGSTGHILNNRPDGQPNAFFGPSWENDGAGNGGNCVPEFNGDETQFDGDAGLTIVDAWSNGGGFDYVISGTGTPVPLGQVYGTSTPGVNFDMEIHNQMPGTHYLNLLVDWDRNGRWEPYRTWDSNGSPATEWPIKDLAVPAGFNGMLSQLTTNPIPVGPFPGLVWCRFVLTPNQLFPSLGLGWNGSGTFNSGESEDYLLQVRGNSANFGDYGDAPEGSTAYPQFGINGSFPTVRWNAEAGFIQHHSNGLLAFGQFVDPENDGNAGATSTNPPNQDECVGGTDAGLIAPSAYTIDDGSTMPCDPLSTTPLGGGCGTVTVGPNLDIAIRNINQGTCYFNLLIDLDYSGSWGGPTQCPLGGDTDEHVFQNIVVPNNFSGELSDLLPGATFTITSPPGYTWARFTLTSVPVPVDWDGSGDFANGETEDYLFRIEGPGLGDYGDAPENALAYPNSGYWGAFATCAADGFPHFVYHRPQGNVWIGATKDFETEGNGGYCTIENQVPDQDECGNNVDGGLVNPDAYTIDANGWDVPCEANQLRPLGQPCTVGTIGPSLNIRLHNGEATSMRFNLLVDWNQDGYWNGQGDCGTYQEDEHLIRNVEVPAGFDGLLSTLTGPTTFNIPSAEGTVWVRATIGENFVSDDWNGFFVFNQGETEDYKLAIINDVSGIPDGGTKPRVLHLGPAFPNPSAGLTAIRYTLPADGPVRLAIFDISGRAIASLDIPHAEAGQHSWEWDGRDELGRLTPAGIYVVKLESGGVTQSMKVTRVR